MPFDQNFTVNGTEYDAWKVTLTMPRTPTVYYYKFKINRDQTNGWYSDDYMDDNDNVHKDGNGASTDGANRSHRSRSPCTILNFHTPAWLQNANVYHILPDRFRNGDKKNDYCRSGAKTGCPVYYGNQQAFTYKQWNTQICDPRNAQPRLALVSTATNFMVAIWRACRVDWTTSSRSASTPFT